jgi:UDP-N-acetyl-2-amino-2-deoxyglucuronate dehydrogenase
MHAVSVGLVGLGWGSRIAAAIRSSAGVTLEACYARTESARIDFSVTHGVRASRTYRELITDGSLHGVIIMTPNSTHRDLTIAALEAGKHVLVTKPISTTLKEAAEMTEAARKCGRVLMVGHQSRRHPALRALKRLVDKGQLGTLNRIEGNTSSPTGLRITADDWRAQPTECPGGPLMQLGIHYVDNFQYLVGPIRHVSAWMGKTSAGALNRDTAAVLVDFGSGASGYLGSSYVVPKTRWIRLSGETGSAHFHDNGTLSVSDVLPKNTTAVLATDNDAVLHDMLAEEISEFADCVRTSKEPEVSCATAARNLAVILAAVESHRQARRVSVDELLYAAGL